MTVVTSHGVKNDGTPVTDALVESLADEAERGYDLLALVRRSRRPPKGGGAAGV